MSTFLQRVQSLSSRGESKAEQKADAEAVAILSQTGVTTSRRKELAQAVAELESSASDGTPHDTSAQVEIERLDALRRIHAWVAMWGDVARTVVTRRDQLIMLGLAKRRSSKREPAPVPAPDNGAVTPVADDAAPPSRAA